MKLVVAGRLKQLNPGTRNTTAATLVQILLGSYSSKYSDHTRYHALTLNPILDPKP